MKKQLIIIFGLFSMLFLPPGMVAKTLTEAKVSQYQALLKKEQSKARRAKILIILIKDAKAKKNHQSEIDFRQAFSKELQGIEQYNKTRLNNDFQLGILLFKNKRNEKARQVFEQLYMELPATTTKVRRILLPYLVNLSQKSGIGIAEENYRRDYLHLMGSGLKVKTRDQYYRRLLIVGSDNGSGMEEIDMEAWLKDASPAQIVKRREILNACLLSTSDAADE